MAKPKRTPLEREQDLARLSQLYLVGKPQVDMATEMGVSQQQISYDLKILQERWVKSGAVNMDEAKSRELAKIDNLERTYWASWETTQKLIVLPDKTSIEASNVPGDPRYLTGVQWCIERRAKLLGLDAPAKQEFSGDALKAYINIDMDKV